MSLQHATKLIAAWEGWRPLRILARPLGRWSRRDRADGNPVGGTRTLAPIATLAPQPNTGLAEARADWADKLWGPGFLMPGGEAEIVRLATLLPLSPATTLLMIGRDAGGAAMTIGTLRGAWMAIHQHDALLTARMTSRLFSLGRRAQVHPWNPAAPAFRAHFHHHALALEPIRVGAAPEPLARSIAAALKPSGQLVLLETVARDPPPEHAAAFQRWLTLECWASPPQPRTAIDLALNLAGFNVHVVEDLGARHRLSATDGWARMIAGIKGENRPATREAAAALVLEAEAWLLRHRLVAAGVISVLRWHASLRARGLDA